MASTYEGNYSSYWPYSCCNSYNTSSYVESPISSSSSREMMMIPVYDQQQQPCYYYYSDPTQYHSFTPPLSLQMSYVSSTRPSRNLPNRFQYTIQQRWLLNEIFQHVPYPNSIQKNVIADRIGASCEQIRIWFQNRRRIAIQVHRSSSQRTNILPIDNNHSLQIELEEILVDLNLHKNAPQRMPIRQSISSRQHRQ